MAITLNLKVISFSHVRRHILLVELLFPVNTYDAFYLISRQYLTKSPAGKPIEGSLLMAGQKRHKQQKQNHTQQTRRQEGKLYFSPIFLRGLNCSSANISVRNIPQKSQKTVSKLSAADKNSQSITQSTVKSI